MENIQNAPGYTIVPPGKHISQDKVLPALKYADQNDIFVTESGLAL